ncbi:hypothetical protein WN944_007888 [Citrus x changshan-huyou]|uniref:Uncharacterized protein n=1 Tax=Citrus x changshan-huyou TaxID=2935761 RepID=A0AAP0QYF2_9ROSI
MGRITVDVLMNMKAVNCISNGLTSEGIWYYHRFNPVGYKADCEKLLFGKILCHLYPLFLLRVFTGSKLKIWGTKCAVQLMTLTLSVWHSHQLLPDDYCKDLREETFGSRYLKAGALFKGNVPSPPATNMNQLDTVSGKVVLSNDNESMIQLSQRMLVESRQRNGSGFVGLRPINLCIALGFASPVPAPYVLRLIPRHSKDWACVVDEAGNEGFNKYRVSDITKSAETLVLAEFYGKGWSSMNSGCFNFKENRMKMTALLHPAQSAGVLSYLINKSKSYFLLRNEVAGEDAAAGRFECNHEHVNMKSSCSSPCGGYVNCSDAALAASTEILSRVQFVGLVAGVLVAAIAVVAAPPEKSLA